MRKALRKGLIWLIGLRLRLLILAQSACFTAVAVAVDVAMAVAVDVDVAMAVDMAVDMAVYNQMCTPWRAFCPSINKRRWQNQWHQPAPV